MGYILYIVFFVFCAVFLSLAMPAKKKLSLLLCAIFGIYFFPISIWLSFFLSIDYSKKPVFPDGFMRAVLYNRENERQMLPVNNDLFISDIDYSKRKTDKKRILILGDSFAAGHGLQYSETFGSRIQSELGNEYEVINAAFFGSNAELQVDYFLSHCATYNPDLIVLWSRSDDVMPVDEKLYLEQTLSILNTRAPLWPNTLKNSVFKTLVLLNRYKFWRYYANNKDAVLKNNLIKPLEILNEYTLSRNIKILLLGDRCKHNVADVCIAALEASKRFHWNYINPYDYVDLDNPENKIPGDGHPTSQSISIISGKVAQSIKNTFNE